MKCLSLLLVAFLAIGPVFAASVESLSDPELESRARGLFRELRCLVCQGQSIDESNAELAVDLRRLVREHIVAGESDAAVKDFLVARYGVFILMQPPLRQDTYVLWFGPAILLLIGAGAIGVTVSRAKRRAALEAAGGELESDDQIPISKV